MSLPNGPYFIINEETSTAFSAPTLSGKPITTSTFVGTPDEQFGVTLTDPAEGKYTIQSKSVIYYAALTHANGPISGEALIASSNAYYWKLTPVGKDNAYYISPFDNDLLVAQAISFVDGVNVTLGPLVGAEAQKWKFTPVP